MTTNIFAEMSGLAGKEQEKFINWMNQYAIVAEVEKLCDEHPDLLIDDNKTEDIDVLQKLRKKQIKMPKPGQIRCLDSALTLFPDRLTAILVLSQWSDQLWLIAPFSPYSLPAIPGELATNIGFQHYSVVEAWNAVVVPEVILCTRTSFLRDAGEQLRKDVCTIFFQQLEGTETPAELIDRVGPGINSELDPRIQYLLGEKQLLRPLRDTLQEVSEFFNSLKQTHPIWAGTDAPTVLAAKDKNDTTSFWYVDNQKVVIKVFVEKAEVRLQVFTYNRESYSSALDSWNVVSESGVILGTVDNGRCRMPQETVTGMFCLAAPNGELIALKEADE